MKKKMFAQSIAFNDGAIQKKIVCLTCSESLNPVSVHVLTVSLDKKTSLNGQNELSIKHWDDFRFKNPELSVTELAPEEIEKVQKVIENPRFKKRIPVLQRGTQSVVAMAAQN